MGPSFLLLSAVLAVVAMVIAIARFKINPFIAIFSLSLILALVAGMPPGDVVKSFETGVGGTLGHIAIVIALGTMLGKMLAESGGAEQIANTLIALFGKRNAHWAMMFIGFIVGLPVFFEVGFVLLMPIAFNVARRTGMSMLMIGLPMVAGLSVVHGLIPPHPAALLAVQAYQADMGHTIFWGVLIGLPVAALAGPIFASIVSRGIILPADNPIEATLVKPHDDKRVLPSFGATVLAILLPVVLMLMGSWADVIAPGKTILNATLHLLGNTDIALLLGVILSFITLGVMRGITREEILRFSNECLAPTAAITLLVGAGGGFGRILIDSGISKVIVDLALGAHISVLLLAWLLAALIRVATGSATVAMTTAANIIAPLAAQAPGTKAELLVLATGAGALILSHVNDGGFWLVKEYFNMSVPQTFRTWTVIETVISLAALALVLLVSTF
ncbi:GntT/GntP/DsdX family permease [Labrys neptuniae]